jgi:hypothetical protein
MLPSVYSIPTSLSRRKILAHLQRLQLQPGAIAHRRTAAGGALHATARESQSA